MSPSTIQMVLENGTMVESWTSLLNARALALGNLIPASVMLLTLLCDILSTVRIHKSIRKIFDTLMSPFRNFLTLDDLEESSERAAPPAVWKIRTLTVGSLLECVLWTAEIAHAEMVGERTRSIRAVVASVTWLYASLRILLKPPLTPPYLLILLYVSHAITAFLSLGLGLMNGIGPGLAALNVLYIGCAMFLVWVAGTLPVEAVLPAVNVAKGQDTPSDELTMPEDSVNLWSWSTFSFVEPIFSVAKSQTLNDNDVWSLSPYFKHKNLFSKYLKYREEHPTHSLLHFLLVSNSLDLILDLVLELWSAVIGFVPPYALQQILSAFSDPSSDTKKNAYFFASLAFLANLSFAQVDLYQSWYTRRCYERTRGQLFCALHYKALTRRDIGGRTSHDDKDGGSADLGQIVNLMQGDAYAVAHRFWQFAGIFMAPIRLAIAMVFLYNILGWSSLAAVAVVLVVYVLNYPLAKYNIYITRHSWKARDRRMNLVNELFQNIRFLKFYGWEMRWTSRVSQARETELKWRVKDNIVSVFIAFIWTWIPSATAVAAFLCFTLVAGEKLTVAKAFTSIALFSYLQEPMMALPGQFFALLHAYVSMQRIEAFLQEDEVPDWASSLKLSTGFQTSITDDIGFDDASFEWDASPRDTPSRFQLGPLQVRFPKGKLTLVSGATGSGKSALLAALLGEMHCTSGRVILNKAGHHVAYCAQNPWLEHATIRDNILFGSTYGYDERRYQEVLEACALNRDLEIFDAGDQTEIGEKGITLSGGQRARIALARALYSQATCILLDDPLAAVDMHTAQHLVKKALAGDLACGRTIILVTHHISLCLPRASYLIELSNGAVLRQGSTEELLQKGQLKKFLEEEDVAQENEPGDSSTHVVENEADLLDQAAEPYPQPKTSGKLVEAEARAEGRVSARTYLTYIRAAGLLSWLLTLVLMILIRLITIGNQFFLARWGEAYETSESSIAQVIFRLPSILERLPPPDLDVRPWLIIFLCISASGAISVIAYISLGYYASLQASRSLFTSMLLRLTAAPSRFFDVTPIGRILNRFTSDINTVDYALQDAARAALSGCLNFLASLSVIIWVVPSFAPFALIIAWLYIRLAPPYVRASRDLRRLESVSLSPAFAGFDELLRGLSHVRAFGMEQRYQDRFYQRVDKFQSFDHVYWLVSGWLRWRYDCLGSVVVFLTTLFTLWSSISSGFAAVVIVQAGVFADASRVLVTVLAQLELDFNSVERIVEYLEVPQEALAIIPQSRPPAYWPSSNGELIVQDLVVRYAPELPEVLRHISFSVRPTEKIGVVGRTGSGKSTLALSLLRIIEPSEGKIIIDGIDIARIGLDDLRTRITIVSQDVSLFSGTIRSNLDPFEEHSDDECWDVLERCHLKSILSNATGKAGAELALDMPIGQTGSMSAGERQLVAMARAVLRRSNVVIMDEATSQIDSNLDDQIQKTIREVFSGAIVITIAHRLKTVLDYDRILVMGGGEILEFDTPQALISKQGGVFRDMCRASTDWQDLLVTAQSHGKK